MFNLTKQDVNVLMQALDAWVDKDAASEMAGVLLCGMMGRTAVEEVVLQQEKEKMQADFAQKKQVRKEQAILLQAKLIALHDSLTVAEATA